MSKNATATAAQARLIALLWSTNTKHGIQIDGYVDSIDRACVKKGFLASTGVTGTWPSGAKFEEYSPTPAGIRAAAEFMVRSCQSS